MPACLDVPVRYKNIMASNMVKYLTHIEKIQRGEYL